MLSHTQSVFSLSNTGSTLIQTSVNMEFVINFIYRGKIQPAKCIICQRSSPLYVYVFFHDKELVQEFGEEVCLHFNNRELLLDHVPPNQNELHLAIFKGMKRMIEIDQVNYFSSEVQCNS